MSLKDSLLKLVREKGTLSYSDAVSFSMSEGYRASNMERRMRELCHEHPIVPITAISKRGTEYVSGWRMKEIGYGLPPEFKELEKIINSFPTITLPPAFKKEIKKQPTLL